MRYDYLSHNGFSIQGNHIAMNCETPRLLIEDRSLDLSFETIGSELLTIGEYSGQITIQACEKEGLHIERHFFTDNTKQMVAMRITITNINTAPVYLNEVSPYQAVGYKNFEIDSNHLNDLRCLKMGRHKLDIPGTFRIGEKDQDFMDAGFQACKLRAGGGVQGDIDDLYNTDRIVSEPLMFLKGLSNEGSGLCTCVLGQERHLTTFYLQDMDDANNSVVGAFLEYDGIQVDQDECVSSHWIVFYESETEMEALEKYTELSAAYHSISKPSVSSTLYCSWYFYGREFYMDDLNENLKVLEESPIPIDAFIIDNGWMDNFGDWNSNSKFPNGMEEAAMKIKAAGMEPGIWTCPFIVMPHSKYYQEHPEIVAKTRTGEPAVFHYVEGDCYVVDPTHPLTEGYFKEVYSRLIEWGFTYHKMDFMRAPVVNEDIVFYNPKVNRAGAYKLGHRLLRKALGDDNYFLSCGGIYDASNFDLADSIRSGSDSIGTWDHPSGNHSAGTLVQIKQGMVRSYLNRFFNVDPDSLMLRRRAEPFRIHETEKHNWLSDGKFTDAEAESLVAKQYICGGSINFSERLAELPENRRILLSKVIPPVTPPAKILDFENPLCPSLTVTEVKPKNCDLDPWYTLSVSNWGDEATKRVIDISKIKHINEMGAVLAFEIMTQEYLGYLEASESISIEIPAHGTRIIRFSSWDGEKPSIIGTDCHLSGGGYELSDIVISDGCIEGIAESSFDLPVTITAVFPGENGKIVRVETKVNSGKKFTINLN